MTIHLREAKVGLNSEEIAKRKLLTERYRSAMGLPDYTTKLQYTRELLAVLPETNLVIGGGMSGASMVKRSEQSEKSSMTLFLVAEADSNIGGLSLRAISSAEHDDQKGEYALEIIRSLYQTNVLFIPNWTVSEQSSDIIRTLNISKIVLADGAIERIKPDWVYGLETSTWASMNFVTMANSFLDEGREDINRFVEEIGWMRKPDGSLKNMEIQGGGRVGLWDVANHGLWIGILDQIQRSGQSKKLLEQTDLHSFVEFLSKSKKPLAARCKDIQDKYGIVIEIEDLPKVIHHYRGSEERLNVIETKKERVAREQIKKHDDKEITLAKEELEQFIALRAKYPSKIKAYISNLRKNQPWLELRFNEDIDQPLIDDDSSTGICVTAIGFVPKQDRLPEIEGVEQFEAGFRVTASGTVDANQEMVDELAPKVFNSPSQTQTIAGNGLELFLKLIEDPNGDNLPHAVDPLEFYVMSTPLHLLERRLEKLEQS